MSFRRVILACVLLLIVAAAFFFLYRAVNRYGIERIVELLGTMPAVHIAWASAFAAASYLCLSGFDYFGVRYADKPLPYPKVLHASFVGLSIGHTIGFGGLSSGFIRYHFYSRSGLTAVDVAKVIVFSGICVATGVSTIAGIGLMFYPTQAEALIGLARMPMLALAATCLVWPWLYLLVTAVFEHPIRVWRWSLVLPAPRLAFAQIALGSLNFALMAASLHQLVAALEDMPYLKLLAVYALGQAAGLLSHVPGGLGVLEATVLYLLPGAASLAALVAFRTIYYFVPLLLGTTLFFVGEVARASLAARRTAH